MRDIDAVLFDFGGVFTASPFGAVEALGAEIGAAPGQLQEIVFGPYHEDTDHPWHRLERGELPLLEARDAIMALGREQGIEVDPFQVFASMARDGGAREGLVERTRALRRAGFRTGLITNNAKEFRDGWRKLVPADELFEVIVDSSEEGIRKPDLRIFERTLERLGGIAPQRALFLDDAQSNLDAAERLGIRGLLVAEDLEPTLAVLDRLLG
jgi:epoxide hydrolase-like predicted phosphatase